MRIQHNIMAMNAYRNYTNNTSAVAKNLEKLSSGYRINRAGDDAAGLAISEKMRAQITGLSAAQKNVKDGISLVKTAEGATQEIHDMLNRMVYLAEQSANGTYQDEVDREAITSEFEALKSEINRIADSSNFNGIKLLDGSLDTSRTPSGMEDVTVDAVADGEQTSVSVSKAGTYELDLGDLKITEGDATATLTDFKIGTASFMDKDDQAIDFSDLDTAGFTGEEVAKKLSGAGTYIELDGIKYDVKVDGAKITLTSEKEPTTLTTNFAVTFDTTGDSNNGWDQAVHIKEQAVLAGDNKLAQGKFALTDTMVKDGGALRIGKETYVFKIGDKSTVTEGSNYKVIDLSDYADDGSAATLKAAAAKLSQQSNGEFDITTDANAPTIYLTEKLGAINYDKSNYDLVGGEDDDADAGWNNVVSTGKMVQANPKAKALTLQIGDTSDSYNQLSVSISDLHTKALGLDSLNLGTQKGSQDAVSAIKEAINTVSSVRGTLGATQNRLEHTANNLSTMKENIQDAESTIRDTDIAEEMMAYTKNNILVQSAQAMLAQANQVPQGVLQLLG